MRQWSLGTYSELGLRGWKKDNGCPEGVYKTHTLKEQCRGGAIQGCKRQNSQPRASGIWRSTPRSPGLDPLDGGKLLCLFWWKEDWKSKGPRLNPRSALSYHCDRMGAWIQSLPPGDCEKDIRWDSTHKGPNLISGTQCAFQIQWLFSTWTLETAPWTRGHPTCL